MPAWRTGSRRGATLWARTGLREADGYDDSILDQETLHLFAGNEQISATLSHPW